ncbi:MAG: enoyl-CoA hydratase-related protein, partial [Burkholderiales bacterium]
AGMFGPPLPAASPPALCVAFAAEHGFCAAFDDPVLTEAARLAASGARIGLAGRRGARRAREAGLEAGMRLGMAAPNNLAWLRLRHPASVAARLVLTGDRVGAAELLRLGVVTEVVEPDRVVPRCLERAAEIATYPAEGVRAIKAALRAAYAGTTPEAWFESFVPARVGLDRLRT